VKTHHRSGKKGYVSSHMKYPQYPEGSPKLRSCVEEKPANHTEKYNQFVTGDKNKLCCPRNRR
jgi:hypothetical protein